MSKDLKSLSLRMNEEIWVHGNADALDQLAAPGLIRHQPPMPDAVGLDAVKQLIRDTLSAYSEIEVNVHEMAHEGDIMASRFTIKMVHTGNSPSIPIPPTGKRVSFTGATITRWKDDRMVEEWVFNDYLGLLQQLGVIPKPG